MLDSSKPLTARRHEHTQLTYGVSTRPHLKVHSTSQQRYPQVSWRVLFRPEQSLQRKSCLEIEESDTEKKPVSCIWSLNVWQNVQEEMKSWILLSYKHSLPAVLEPWCSLLPVQHPSASFCVWPRLWPANSHSFTKGNRKCHGPTMKRMSVPTRATKNWFWLNIVATKKQKSPRAGEIAQWLRALTAHTEDPGYSLQYPYQMASNFL